MLQNYQNQEIILPLDVLEDEKSSFEHASFLLKKLTNLSSSWVLIKLNAIYDSPSEIEDGERIITLVYTTMIPEQVKILDKEYSWYSVIDINNNKSINQKHLQYIRNIGSVV